MVRELIAQFEALDDPRCDRKAEHKLVEVLVIAVCVVLAEAESFEDIALYGRDKRLLMPSSDRPARRPWRQYT